MAVPAFCGLCTALSVSTVSTSKRFVPTLYNMLLKNVSTLEKLSRTKRKAFHIPKRERNSMVFVRICSLLTAFVVFAAIVVHRGCMT